MSLLPRFNAYGPYFNSHGPALVCCCEKCVRVTVDTLQFPAGCYHDANLGFPTLAGAVTFATETGPLTVDICQFGPFGTGSCCYQSVNSFTPLTGKDATWQDAACSGGPPRDGTGGAINGATGPIARPVAIYGAAYTIYDGSQWYWVITLWALVGYYVLGVADFVGGRALDGTSDTMYGIERMLLLCIIKPTSHTDCNGDDFTAANGLTTSVPYNNVGSDPPPCVGFTPDFSAWLGCFQHPAYWESGHFTEDYGGIVNTTGWGGTADVSFIGL